MCSTFFGAVPILHQNLIKIFLFVKNESIPVYTNSEKLLESVIYEIPERLIKRILSLNVYARMWKSPLIFTFLCLQHSGKNRSFISPTTAGISKPRDVKVFTQKGYFRSWIPLDDLPRVLRKAFVDHWTYICQIQEDLPYYWNLLSH